MNPDKINEIVECVLPTIASEYKSYGFAQRRLKSAILSGKLVPRESLLTDTKQLGNKMRHFIYFEKNEKRFPIRIIANKKPSENTIPERGTWILREWDGANWVMPCFPEITWGTLKKLIYFGELKNEA